MCCRAADSTGGSIAFAARAQLYDIVRLDHFRGFEAYWSIPASDETAVNGEWVKAPGLELFRALEGALGPLPLVAEDLGLITPEVDALRIELGMPGMKVIQFGFGDKGAHIHLPHRYTPETVAYTGTHDNDTTQGWWKTAGKAERAAVTSYIGDCQRTADVAADPRESKQAWQRWRWCPRRICLSWARRRA